MAGREAPKGRSDFAPYTGRWVAVVKGRVAGVGSTAKEAYLSAKRSRPKEEPKVVFVPADSTEGDEWEKTYQGDL